MLSRFFSFLLNPRAPLRPRPTLNNGEQTRPQSRLTWRDILFNLPLLLGGIIVLGLILTVLFGPLFATHDPHITALSVIPHFDAELGEMVRPPFPPSETYPFGTDNWGNDMLSLILHGARVTLVAVFYITLGRILMGTILGGLAGWFTGRWPDQVVTALIAVITSLPILLSSYILIFALGIRNGLPVFLAALTVTGWTEIAQVVRSELLVIRKQLYIEAAIATGLRGLQIVVRHVLPNILPQLLVVSFLEMSAALLLLAELGFLGVFIGGGSAFSMGEMMAPPTPIPLPEIPEWGMLISQGVNSLRAFPHKLLAPALTVFVAVMGLNIFGEGLRTLLDKASVNTSFLLRRRMILVVAGLVALSAFVLDYTGPKASYQRVAQTFSGENAAAQTTTLQGLDPLHLDAEGHNEPAVYLAEQFTTLEWDRGWRPEGGFSTSYFYAQATGQLWVQPTVTPTLALLDAQGQPQTSFMADEEFGFLVQGHGGSGRVTAPLTFVGFEDVSGAEWGELSLRGRIAVLREGNAPPNFATEALRRGAQGVIWLTEDAAVHSETRYAEDAATNYFRNPTLPIMRLSHAASERLLQQVGLTLTDVVNVDEAVSQQGDGWFGREWEVQLAMNVALMRPQPLSQTSLIAFKSGYGSGLADEVVVLLVCDPSLRLEEGADASNTPSTALLLELAQVWQAQNVNPIRSMLLIAWAGTPAEAQAFLADPENFARLNPMLPSAPLLPAYVIVLDAAASDASGLWLNPTSDPLLLDVFTSSAEELDIAVSTQEGDELAAAAPLTLDVPVLYVRWGIDERGWDAAAYTSTGQALSLGVIKLIRQIIIEP